MRHYTHMLETVDVSTPPTEGYRYKRLTRADHITILGLREQNLSFEDIAQRLSRSISTIHEVVSMYQPTTDLAKRRLQASAVEMAENIIANGRAADHVKTLEGLDVLSSQEVKGGLTIIVGSESTVQINVGGNGLSPVENSVVGEGVQKR